MELNLNNYEEYFLMYADNELSAMERVEVENFVKENPSVAEEFNLIKETVLLPEKEVIFNKEILFRSETNPAVHELLHLIVDNELTPEEKSAATQLIDTDPLLKKELALLSQTVSRPDLKIKHPDKRTLYKKEGRVIPIMYRIAAAAVIVGFGLWFTTFYSNDKGVIINQTAVNAPSVLKSTKSDSSEKLTNSRHTADSKNENDLVATGSPKKAGGNKEAVNVDPSASENKDTKEIKESSNRELAVNVNASKQNKPSNDLPQPDPSYNYKPSKTESVTAVSIPENKVDNSIALKDNIAQSEQTGYKVQPVSYVETDVNNDDSNPNLQQEFHKSKLGGFLKKASRTIARNLKVIRNDDQD